MTHPLDLDAIFEAIIFAARKHHGQERKDGHVSPYITHPLAVARVIFSIGQVYDQDILNAAILHDTLEDTQTSPNEIRARFGEDVLAIILQVSDDKSLEKNLRKQLQVLHAQELSYPARIIKLADKLCNCRDMLHIPPKNWELKRRQDYIQWAADVIAQVRGTNPNLEAAFDELIIEAEAMLNFHLEPFETVNNRPWGPGASNTSA